MNTIKYINPRSGEMQRIRVSQMGHTTFLRWWRANPFERSSRRPFMAEADAEMLRRGFVRAGRRWKGRKARLALSANRIKNALMDNARLKP